MVVVTLIGEDFAEVGKTFVFRGPITECRDCKLKGICFNLDAGCRYCVKEVRDVHNECRIHESGVCAAEVEKLNISGAVPKKYALEGSTLSFNPTDCNQIGCENYRLCHPTGVTKGMRFKIISAGEELNCPAGQRMIKVVLE